MGSLGRNGKNGRRWCRWIVPLTIVFAALPAVAATPTDLRCDHRSEPLAVEVDRPGLSWRLPDDDSTRGIVQSAYRIQAADAANAFDAPRYWDSGWVADGRSHAVAYAGATPPPGSRVHWRVRIRDADGREHPYSDPTWFDIGLGVDHDWGGAAWIGSGRAPGPQYGPADVMGDWLRTDVGTGETTYRHRFILPEKPIVHAGAWWNRVADGEVVLRINDQVGLTGAEGPPTVHYRDFGFDLRTDNELMLTLSDGPADAPVCFGMRVVFDDGTEAIVRSGDDWTVRTEGEPGKVRPIDDDDPTHPGRPVVADRETLDAAWFRRDFEVNGEVDSARLYVCGLGYFEPYLNGIKVGDHVLDPGQTDYDHFAHYQTFDVTRQLRTDNVLAILLGDGWYNNDRMFSHARFGYGPPGLRAMLHLRYADGRRETIVSDDDWRWKPSGLTSGIFRGDRLDYRRWTDDWRTPGGGDDWIPAVEVSPLSPKLVAQDFPPIRVTRRVEPVSVRRTGPKTWLADFGENLSGWVTLPIDEPAGTRVHLRCMESLGPDGVAAADVPGSFSRCHAVPQSHTIIADGRRHVWRPRFSYQGFRHVEVSGLSDAPDPATFRALVVHTDLPVRASFESSDPLLDRIFRMGIRTHLNNAHSILEDCPTREKCLWGGDLHSSWATGFSTLDSAAFYRQQVRLFYTPPLDRRGPIPGRIGVGRRSTNLTFDTTWSVSPLFIAHRLYRIHGDLTAAEEHFDAMRRFLRFTEGRSDDLIPRMHRYGDHAAPVGIDRPPADSRLIAAMHFYAAANRFAELATAMGRDEPADWSSELARRIAASINERYFDAASSTYGNGTHDSLALAFGLVPDDRRARVAESLARTYRDNGGRFDGGFMSYEIYPQLTRFGHVDLALSMLRNTDYPGLAQSIRDHDATTVFEQFRNDGWEEQFELSLDHHAMNHPTAWLLNDVAGIAASADHPGMRRIRLAPRPPKQLDHAAATLRTRYGTVRSGWRRDGDRIEWSVHLPPNSDAVPDLPPGATNIRHDGRPLFADDLPRTLPPGDHRITWTESDAP